MKVPRTVELMPIVDRKEFMRMALDHFRELNPAFVPAPDWQENYFNNIQKNQGYSLRWIRVDEKIAGFVLFGIEKHKFLPRKNGAIYELYIVPDQRRKGVASRCAKLVIEELWKSSPSKIQLEVVCGNQAAALLWEGLGFSKASERFILSREAGT